MNREVKYKESELLRKLSFRENAANVRRVLRLLLSLDKYYVAWNVFIVLLSAALTYGGMLLSAYILNSIAGGFVFSKLIGKIIAWLIAFSLGWSLCSFLNRSVGIRESVLVEKYETMQQEKIMELDFSLIDSPRLYEIRERIRKDNNWGAGIYSIFWQVRAVLGSAVNLIAAVLIGLPMFGYFRGDILAETGLTAAVMAVCLVLGMKGIWYFSDMTCYSMFHEPTREEKKYLYPYTWEFAFNWGSYRYENGKDARIYGAYDVLKHWTYDKQQSKEYKDAYIRLPAIGFAGSSAVGNILFVIGLIGAYIIVAIAAIRGGMPVGSVVLYAGCLANILQEIESFLGNCQEISMSARKQIGILELLELSDEMYKGSLPLEKRSDNQYHIEFRDVSFRYPGREEYALRHFSMELKAGEKLAIVGRNGSGKTTMIKLLCRLYDPQEGEILVNGVDIRKFRHEEYSKLFSVVFQDYKLFSLMLAENVAADKEYDAEKVRRCLTDAGFGERLAQMGEEGLASYLYKDYSDAGLEISGGEAQKIAIARAIYKEAPFVLLDEPTAALDPIAESEIYENFDRIAGEKTAVYISHRLSSCKFCDRIAVFDEGRLVQMGSHEELLAERDGTYAALWNAQAKYYEMAAEHQAWQQTI